MDTGKLEKENRKLKKENRKLKTQLKVTKKRNKDLQTTIFELMKELK